MKIIAIILLFLSINCYSQTCTINGIEDWEKVEMRVIEDRDNSRKYCLLGEGKIDVHDGVNKLSDLNKDEIKKIKEKAANRKSCLVFVDIKDITASEQFPIRKKGKLYFYYVLQRTEPEALTLINKIHNELVVDSSFCKTAKLYSEDQISKSNCGEVKWSKKDPPPDDYKNALKTIKEGELSKPFKSAYGYSIVYFVKKEKKETVVRHILITYQ